MYTVKANEKLVKITVTSHGKYFQRSNTLLEFLLTERILW